MHYLRTKEITILGLILLDQLIKRIFINLGNFQINSGISFGMGEQLSYLWPIISLILILWLLRNFKFTWKTVLIISGASSNLIDRLRWNGVIDYINFWIFPSFNLADVLILAGTAGLLYSFLYEKTNGYLRR